MTFTRTYQLKRKPRYMQTTRKFGYRLIHIATVMLSSMISLCWKIGAHTLASSSTSSKLKLKLSQVKLLFNPLSPRTIWLMQFHDFSCRCVFYQYMNFGEKIFYVTLPDFAGRHGSNLTQSVVRGIFHLLRYTI